LLNCTLLINPRQIGANHGLGTLRKS
jgi:hypothetical protein